MNALDAAALRSIRGAIPDVRPPAKWFEPGQGFACSVLGAVIACEMAFIGWCLFFR